MIYFLYSLLLLTTWSNTDLARTPENKPALSPVILLDSITPATCSNNADGAIFITIKQAELPVSYIWSNGATTEDLLDLPAGVYGCTVTDANGEISALDDILVEAPPALLLNTDSIATPDCLGNAGYIAVSAEGGTPSYTYVWNNGDINPVLEDLTAGIYSVTATDANGCTAVAEFNLETDFPVAATADAEINCANAIVALSADGSTTGDQISYSWSTAGGIFVSNPDSFTVYAAAPGYYDLLVTNTQNGCTASAQALVTIDSVPPVIDLGDDITVACTNTTDTLWSNGPTGPEYTYMWMALDGGHLSGNANQQHAIFDHTGTFVLTVVNTTNGCQAIDTIVVSGLNAPPSATVAGDTLSCLLDSVALSAEYDTLNTVWVWQGPGGFSSTLPEPTVGSPGAYWFTLTDTLTGCFIQKTALVAADTAPAVILYTFGGALTCVQTEVQIGVETDSTIATGYYWYGPDGFESAEQSPVVSEPGSYVVFATNLANGCSVSDTLDVAGNFTLPNADAGDDQIITCAALQISLDGTASSQGDQIVYVWTTLDGNILSGDSTDTPVVDATGAYTLTVIDAANGCSASDEVVVTTNVIQPTVSADVTDTLSCDLTEVTISGSVAPDNDVEYAWSGPNGFTSQELTLIVTEPGVYTLTATHLISGCTAEASAEVFSTAPIASAGPSKVLNCIVSNVVLEGNSSLSGDNIVISWTTPDGHIVSGENTLSPVVDAAGTYFLTVADTINLCEDVASTTVVWDTLAPEALAGPDQLLTCSTSVVTLDASASNGNGALQFDWTTDSGHFVNGENTATPQVDAAGLYYLSLTDASNGCFALDSVLVGTDLTLPVATATAFGTLTCVSTNVPLSGTSSIPGSTFQWSGPGGFSSSVANPVVTVPGTYTLVVTNPANGCMGTASVTVVQNTMPPVLTASAGPLTCSHPDVMIMTTVEPAMVNFLWTGPGGFSSTLQNPTVTAPGNYSVVVTNPANGCTNSVSVTVTQNVTPPSVSAAPGGILTCTQTSLTLNATATPAGTTFAWTGPDGFVSSLANPTVNAPGVYTVTATHPVNGCTSQAVTFVESNAIPPTAYAGQDLPLNCVNGFLTLNGTGSSTGSQITYSWSTPDGNIVIGQNTLMPRVDAPGTYTLLVTNTANGCTATDEAIITAPTNVTAVISQSQNVSCNGGSNGSATVLAGGGTLVYFYNWSNGNQTATADNLGAGLYAVTVTDQASCTATATVNISEPTALTVNINVTAETLPGANNGTATAAAQGGTGAYSYLWETGATSASIGNLAPGAYPLTVTDANGCTATGVANINPSSCALAALVLTTSPSCFGYTNGSATANVSGANGPATYQWSTGATVAAIQNLAVGSYSLTVSDGAGCQAIVPFQITGPQALGVTLVSQQNVLCADDAAGALGIAASGGTAPYSYLWSNGNTNNALSNLLPGAYGLTVTDQNGCSHTFNSSITATDQNPPLVQTHDATVELNSNGTAVLTAAMIDAGTADGECSLASLAVSPSSFDCSALGAHTVVLTATDVNGNSSTGTATVTVTDNIVPVLNCPANIEVGACEAQVQFATPGVSDNCPYNPAQLVQESGLASCSVFPAGTTTTQTYRYTDAAGNTATCSFTVKIGSELTVAQQVSPASCGQICDGSISLDLNGAQPLSIVWNTGATTPQQSDLCFGFYGATVTDAYGCTKVLDIEVPSADTQAPTLLLQNATAALGPDGLAVISAELFDQGSSDNCGVINWTLSATEFSCDQIGEHTIDITATDESGNIATQSVVLTIIDNIAPTLLCPDDIVVGLCNATVDFAQPIVLDNCDTGAPEQITGLPSGSEFPQGDTQVLFASTDPSGNTGTCSFHVVVQESFNVAATVTNVSCPGACNGQILLNIGGSGPYTVVWSNGSTTQQLQNLCAGAYEVVVSDASGCSQSFDFEVTEPQAITLVVDDVSHDINNAGVGSIDMSVFGGTSPYAYQWYHDGAPFANTEDVSGLTIGSYQLVVTDANGCTASGPSIVIINNVSSTGSPEQAFNAVLAPNPAYDQTELRFDAPLRNAVNLQLFDATGRLVRTEQIGEGTERYTLDLHDLPAGAWRIILLADDGQYLSKTLIRMR